MENRNLIESLQQKLKDKQKEIELTACDWAEEKNCGMCYDTIDSDRRLMCFFPCGHARFCQSCYGSLPNPKKCPECRIKIQKAAILFY